MTIESEVQNNLIVIVFLIFKSQSHPVLQN